MVTNCHLLLLERKRAAGRSHKSTLERRHQPRPLSVRCNSAIDLLRRFNDVHARERRSNRRTRALPGERSAQEPAARDWRHMQGVLPTRECNPGLTQKVGNLLARIGPAVPKRRRVKPRRDYAPLGDPD